MNIQQGIRFPSEARMLQWLFQVIQLLQQLIAHHQPILSQLGKQNAPTQTACLSNCVVHSVLIHKTAHQYQSEVT